MKQVLLTNRELVHRGGSETWLWTMYRAMEELGHRPTAVTAHGRHKLWPEMNRIQPGYRYHLALVNHIRQFPAPMWDLMDVTISTSHGMIKPEEPAPGADHYVAVSEEVRDKMSGLGYTAEVIRNPIDTDDTFRPLKPLSKTLKRVLVMSNAVTPDVVATVEAAAGDDIEVWKYGTQWKSSDAPQDVMNEVDLVVGLGRTCYEAMACGRNVIVYGQHGGAGFVTAPAMLEYRTHNCSGRSHGLDYAVQDLREEFSKYDPSIGEGLREYVIENNHWLEIANEYLGLAWTT